ncbi:hypothetical protein T492DRAFT_951373 [Pavlovales sp. CCMP2436]|nr:hypothetical protein T492DRAFT_951373 [Pavlovales sp. CCMP2436]
MRTVGSRILLFIHFFFLVSSAPTPPADKNRTYINDDDDDYFLCLRARGGAGSATVVLFSFFRMGALAPIILYAIRRGTISRPVLLTRPGASSGEALKELLYFQKKKK